MSDTSREGRTPEPGKRVPGTPGSGKGESGAMLFWSGLAAGVAATAAVAQGLLAGLVIPSLRLALSQYGAEVPAVTRVATGPAWSWGAPLGIALACLLAGIVVERERPRLAIFSVLAVAAVAAFAFTYWASSYPVMQLSGEITAD